MKINKFQDQNPLNWSVSGLVPGNNILFLLGIFFVSDDYYFFLIYKFCVNIKTFRFLYVYVIPVARSWTLFADGAFIHILDRTPWHLPISKPLLTTMWMKSPLSNYCLQCLLLSTCPGCVCKSGMGYGGSKRCRINPVPLPWLEGWVAPCSLTLLEFVISLMLAAMV